MDTHSMFVISFPSLTFFILILFVCLFLVQGNEPGTSNIQDKYSTTELQPSPNHLPFLTALYAWHF